MRGKDNSRTGYEDGQYTLNFVLYNRAVLRNKLRNYSLSSSRSIINPIVWSLVINRLRVFNDFIVWVVNHIWKFLAKPPIIS